MTEYKKGTTDGKRTILRKRGGEEPRSARANWLLWKYYKDLEANEISVLITKRRQDLKYLKDEDDIKRVRNEIRLLEDIYKINKRKEKEVKKT
jgi:hypothetical protein